MAFRNNYSMIKNSIMRMDKSKGYNMYADHSVIRNDDGSIPLEYEGNTLLIKVDPKLHTLPFCLAALYNDVDLIRYLLECDSYIKNGSPIEKTGSPTEKTGSPTEKTGSPTEKWNIVDLIESDFILVNTNSSFEWYDSFTEIDEDPYLMIGALSLASFFGSAKSLELLLSCGAKPTVEQIEGRSAIHWACLKNNVDCLKHLIAYEVDVNVCDEDDRTPLHYTRTAEIAELLIKAGANVNHCCEYGTPLHTQIKGFSLCGKGNIQDWIDSNEQPKIIKLFMNAGADKMMGDADGYKPYDDAVERLMSHVGSIITDESVKGLYESVMIMTDSS